MQPILARAAFIVVLIAPSWLGAAQDPRHTQDGIFSRFSHHIQQQVESDKLAFAKASGCTNWFYQQEKHKPAPTDVQRIAFHRVLVPPSREDCLRDYPGGLESVREDFHRTQTSLSVSLTFYEFALVGDRDDDAHYNPQELLDVFESLTLPYDPTHSIAVQTAALTERFDAWCRTRNLESLMNGMGELYDKGYRVSPADRAELDRVTK